MSIFNRIEELLVGKESFALAVIVSRFGSAPRDVGSRMVVRKDASIIGTVGGGLIEAQVQRIAMEVLGDGKPVFRKFSFTAKEAAQMAMICGGEVEVLVYFVDALDASNLALYQQITETLRSRKRAWLITGIPQGCRTAAPLQADGMGGAIPRMLPVARSCRNGAVPG